MPKASRGAVYAAINTERSYQDQKWNPESTTSNGQHSFEEWFMYIEDYVNEAKHILSRETKQLADAEAAHIMRKVGAMAVAAMEQLGAPKRPGAFNKDSPNVTRDIKEFYDGPLSRAPHQSGSGNTDHTKIVIRHFPDEAPNEFWDETIWVGKDFKEGVSEHRSDISPFSCQCEECTRSHHHLKTREDVAREKKQNK